MTMKSLRNLKKSDVLNAIGLTEHTPKSNIMTGVGVFAVGILVGAGLGLLFAPKRGRETRAQVGEALKRGTRIANDYARDVGVEGSLTRPNA